MSIDQWDTGKLLDIPVEGWLELRQPRWLRLTRFVAEGKSGTMTRRYRETRGMVK
jgi:hypothetical protein